jgi:hypothetical protein
MVEPSSPGDRPPPTQMVQIPDADTGHVFSAWPVDAREIFANDARAVDMD